MGAQANIGEVVTGLCACTADVHHCGKDECPYWTEDACEYRLMSDAYALIGELMPRVLSLDEAVCADECWFEWKDGPCGYAEILWSCKDTVDINRIHSHGSTGASIYGKAWRCWNHRPTDAQRKAAKWNEQTI